MKYAIALVVAPAAVIGGLFFGAPTALADPIGNSINHNPGLQVNCAFNPAFRNMHKKDCGDISVETVASNGSGTPEEPETPPNEGGGE